jgi:hypothetical protein
MLRFIVLFIGFLLLSIGLSADEITEPGRWKEISTEHFIFIYREKDKAAVAELVTYCEDVYNKVTQFLDSYPKEIRCIVLGNTDEANGIYTFPPHHIELNVATSTTIWASPYTENYLKEGLIHELTHYVQIKTEKGMCAVLASIFGDALKGVDFAFMPGWLIEGFTTNTETIFTKGGRGRNSFFEIVYRAPLLEDHFFTLEQAEYSSPFPPQDKIYVAGYIFINYLMEKYGQDVVKRINDEFQNWPLFGPWGAIKKVTGSSAQELFAAMKQELLLKYEQDRLLPQGELLSPSVISDYYMPIITEKGWYMYRTNLTDHEALVQYDPVLKKEKILFETKLSDECSLTSDKKGDIIVYASASCDTYSRLAFSEMISDLYVYDTATGKATRLTNKAHLYYPALSGDGEKLIAVQLAGAYSRLVEVDPKTGEIALLFAQEGSTVYNPVFSPDRKRIAFVLNRNGMQDIYFMQYPLATIPLQDSGTPLSYNEEKAQPLLGTDYAGDYYPRFVDDDTLIFSSDRGGSLALYTYTISSKDFFLICEEPVAAFIGYKTEDGIIYASYSWRGFCVKKMAVENLVHKKVSLPVSEPYAQTPQWKEVNGTDYIDWPIFQFWLPYPNIQFLSSDKITWGGGIYVMGASPLQTTMYDIALSFFPETLQPVGTVNFQTALGNVDIKYSLGLSYQYNTDDLYEQTISNTLTFSLPLVTTIKDSVENNISIYGGLQYSYNLYNAESFAFLNQFDFNSLTQENVLRLVTGLDFSFAKKGGIIDYYEPWAFIGNISVQVPLPVFPNSKQGIDTLTQFTLNFPTFIPHTILKLGVKASYTSQELLDYPVIQARGLFDVEPQKTTGQALCSLDCLFPIAILEQPLFGGLHLDGIGGGFHVEALANWQFNEDYFAFEKNIYAGCELSVIIGLGMWSIPIGVGVSFRIDSTFQRVFNPASDIRPYFFFGFNSFFDTILF